MFTALHTCYNTSLPILLCLYLQSVSTTAVVFNRLLFKLQKSGLNDKLLIWVKSWLTNRTQQVIVDGSHSRMEPVLSGVPQGTVLGPLLFLVYINDINSDIKSTLRLFADDSIYIGRSHHVKINASSSGMLINFRNGKISGK